MALITQALDVAYEADLDQFFVNRDLAADVIVLDPLKIFFVPNVDVTDAVSDLKVGQVALAKLIRPCAGKQPHYWEPIRVRAFVFALSVFSRPEDLCQFLDRERFALLRLAIVQAAPTKRVVPQGVLSLRDRKFEQTADPLDVPVERLGTDRRRV